MIAYTFVIVFLSVNVVLISGYQIPEVTVQALKNGEFRVYIPDTKGLKQFGVHAKINTKIIILEPGDFFAEVKEKDADFWIAKFSNANIKAGDTVYIWVSVIIDSFSYRKEGINVTIGEPLDSYPKLESKCVKASTVFGGGKQSCLGDAIINEEFTGAEINAANWIVEHWIPAYSPPCYIFNSYQNKDDTRFVKSGILYLKPGLIPSGEERGILDLTDGCTSKERRECYHRTKSWQLVPPVKSAKINSKTSFKYGRIDVKAKLPAGEWIFPIIQLEQSVKEDGESSPKVLIAYSRGNNVLVGVNQNDIGSRILYAGPVRQPNEPQRSQDLITRRASKPFNSEFHVYTLEWVPGKMTFKVDDGEYGSVDLNKRLIDDIDIRGSGSTGSSDAPYDTEYLVSLGVAVGGLLDFPDGYTSNNHRKPWLNTERGFIKEFFDKRSEWTSTWKGDDVALQVDYVKVTAL